MNLDCGETTRCVNTYIWKGRKRRTGYKHKRLSTVILIIMDRNVQKHLTSGNTMSIIGKGHMDSFIKVPRTLYKQMDVRSTRTTIEKHILLWALQALTPTMVKFCHHQPKIGVGAEISYTREHIGRFAKTITYSQYHRNAQQTGITKNKTKIP